MSWIAATDGVGDQGVGDGGAESASALVGQCGHPDDLGGVIDRVVAATREHAALVLGDHDDGATGEDPSAHVLDRLRRSVAARASVAFGDAAVRSLRPHAAKATWAMAIDAGTAASSASSRRMRTPSGTGTASGSRWTRSG